MHEIARVLSSRGITATVVGDAVVTLLPRQQPTEDGGRLVTYLHCSIRSLDDLREHLGDDGSETFWNDALTEMAEPSSANVRAADGHPSGLPSETPPSSWKIDRLLPQFSTRSVVCGMMAFLLSTAAWQDLMSDQPAAPIGSFAVALFFLWQAYRRPPALQSDTTPANGQAKLYALAASAVFLVMLMMLGHSVDGFLFGSGQRPLNTMAVFVMSVMLLVFLRNGEQRVDPASMPPGGGPFGMSLRTEEAAFAIGGFAWLLVLALMPPHRPVFEHGLATSTSTIVEPAAQASRQ